MERKAILVTGASSGIGRLLTQRLAGLGHLVYAAARVLKDLDPLTGVDNIRPLQIDVTDSQSISAAAAEIQSSRSGLYGIVNNAGVATFGSVLGSPQAEFDLVMAVNVRGTYLVTRAFAPFVIEQKGRIVMIGSIAGILAEKNLSAYSMSKHATEALVDSLAREMAPLDVGVSIVEPGPFKTRLAEKIGSRIGSSPGMPDLSARQEPHAVVLAITNALFDTSPKRRYLVVVGADEARRTIGKQIERLVELNQGHAFSFDRDQLVRLLDEVLQENFPAASR